MENNHLQNLENEINKLKHTHVFNFINPQTNQKIGKGHAGTFRSQNVWELDEIISKYGSFRDFLIHLKNTGNQAVKVVFLKRNGNRYTTTNLDEITITLQKQETAPELVVEKPLETQQLNFEPVTTPGQQIPAQTIMTPIVPVQQPMLGGSNGTIGLGIGQYMDFIKKESRLELVEKENRRLDEENLLLNRKNNKLQLDLDAANSSCTLAGDRLTLEKEKIENSTKTWTDSPLAAKVAENIPALLEFLSKSQTGSPQPQAQAAGLSGPEGFENASPALKQLVSVIIQANPDEKLALSLYEIFTAVTKNPELVITIKQVIAPEQTA